VDNLRTLQSSYIDRTDLGYGGRAWSLELGSCSFGSGIRPQGAMVQVVIKVIAVIARLWNINFAEVKPQPALGTARNEACPQETMQ
jgi:hypothetical protein